jgi:hypothetical protein
MAAPLDGKISRHQCRARPPLHLLLLHYKNTHKKTGSGFLDES